MKFLENAEAVHTDDPYYDLFDGGYIDPYNLLEQSDAEKLAFCVETIKTFLREAEQKDIIVVC